jgi:hypothetical protein
MQQQILRSRPYPTLFAILIMGLLTACAAIVKEADPTGARDRIEPAAATRPAVEDQPVASPQTALPTTQSDAVGRRMAMIQAFGMELSRNVGGARAVQG